jgi:radical SAM protein with 4Fe4S-binding SPASM domain
MCPIQFRQDGPPHGPPAFMKIEMFEALLQTFDGLERLHLQGLGEPMMHPRFFDMVRFAVDRGVRVTTNSNLTLLNERRAKDCVNSGLDELHVSIDGATAETYERIRVRAHFDRVLANVRLLSEAKERAGSAKPNLHLVMVLMRDNLDELPDIVRLAAGLQIEEVFVQQLCHDFGEESLPSAYKPMRDFVDGQTLLTVGAARVETVFAEARHAATEANIRLRLPPTRLKLHPPGTPGIERCDWPWTGAYVSYDGHVMPCCMISTPDRLSLGRLQDAGFVQIWEGEEYESFRSALSSDSPPGVCASCSIYKGTF